jgi:D-erythro-7,8-dihydroneopterin triphosphate epimerase
MHDKIFVNDLIISCIIGVFDFERKSKQNVIISIELHLDLSTPGKTDNIKDTVSYQEIVDEITKKVEESKYHLLEALAEMVAAICLKDNRVKHAHVKIEKPKAILNAKSSAVEIIRKNE